MFTQALGLLAAFGTLTAAMPAHHARRHAHGHSKLQPRDDITSDGVQIVNNLGRTVYLWSVSDVSSEMYTINSGESYAENWQTNPNGGGISIKLSFEQSPTDPLQFEYTLEDPTIWWDLSCIDMGTASEFTTSGFSVTSNAEECESATCAAGDDACAAAYLIPSDNYATHACASNVLMQLNLGPATNATI